MYVTTLNIRMSVTVICYLFNTLNSTPAERVCVFVGTHTAAREECETCSSFKVATLCLGALCFLLLSTVTGLGVLCEYSQREKKNQRFRLSNISGLCLCSSSLSFQTVQMFISCPETWPIKLQRGTNSCCCTRTWLMRETSYKPASRKQTVRIHFIFTVSI